MGTNTDGFRYKSYLIDKKIKEIKEVFGENVNCYLFAVLLATNFIGEVLHDGNHVVCRIDDVYYDSKGAYDWYSEFDDSKYMPISEYGTEIEKSFIDVIVEQYFDIDNT